MACAKGRPCRSYADAEKEGMTMERIIEKVGTLVFEAARKAILNQAEVRCDFVLFDCEVFVRPFSSVIRAPTYFWLGAEGGG